MKGLVAIYILALILGLVWVMTRFIAYLRNKGEMEARWGEAMYDDGFKAYVETLKKKASNDTDERVPGNNERHGEEEPFG